SGPDLPGVKSFSQDHWGYYNGASNSSLIPALTTQEKVVYNSASNINANREPNANSTAALLSKIVYPTGGYTEFTFGPHEASVEVLAPGVITSVGARAYGSEPKTHTPYEQGLYQYYM